MSFPGFAPSTFGVDPTSPYASQILNGGSATGAANPIIDNLAGSLPGGTSVADYMAGGAGLAGAAAPATGAAASWMGPAIAGRLTSFAGFPGAGLASKAGGFLASPLGPAALGLAGTQAINALIPSTTGTSGTVREALADASTGAGLGGTLGTIIGTPGVGTAIGAGIGGVAGGLYGLLGGLGGGGSSTSDKDLRSTLENNAKMMGLSPSDYTSKFDLMTKTGMTDAKGNKLSNQDIANMLGSTMSNEVTTTRAQNQASAQALELHKADLANNLALQTQAQQFMQPYTNNIISSGVNQAQVLNNLAGQMPSAYKGLFQAQAANALNQSQQMAGAYAQQISLQPSMQIMNNYTQQQATEQQKLNQALQLAVQMRSQGAGGGAGGVNFANLAPGVQVGTGGGTVPGVGY